MNEKVFVVPDENIEELFKYLKMQPFTKQRTKRNSIKYLDTFNNLLLKNDLVVIKKGIKFQILDIKKNYIIEEIESRKNLKDAKDFPESIRKIITNRALIEHFEIEEYEKEMLLEDEEGQKLLDFRFVEQVHEKPGYDLAIKNLLFLEYTIEAKNLISDIKNKFDLKKIKFRKRIIELFTDHSDYFKKHAEIDFETYKNCKNKKIFEHIRDRMIVFHNTITLNEEGIIEDLDDEFLHDFRVSLRKTRTAISQFKDIFPEEIKNYKSKLKMIQQLSNKARDLDVLLTKKDYLYEVIPDKFHDGLGNLLIRIKRERNIEYKKLQDYISTLEYKAFLIRFKKFLLNLDNYNLPAKARTNSCEYARNMLSKKYKTIWKDLKNIDPVESQESLHQLRIDCKKFRYLLEFFEDCFSKKHVKHSIKFFKKLQDNLGDLNDAYNQYDLFEEYFKRDISKSKNDEKVHTLTALLTLTNQAILERKDDTFTTINSLLKKRKDKIIDDLLS